MARGSLSKSAPCFAGMFAGMLPGIFAVLVFITGSLHSAAQAAPAQRAFNAPYDKAHEITITGAIDRVVTQRIAGNPVGLHLLVAGSQGTVDAHLGAFLSRDIVDALHTGEPVEIIGAMKTINGKDYLLARQLTVDGRTIIIRNQRGFLMHSFSRKSPSPIGSNGGAQ